MAQDIKIAIVDDELDMRQSISQWLSLSGFQTQAFASAKEALAVIKPGFEGIVVTDIKMPEMDGMAFLKRLMHLDSALPVVLITGHGDVPMAVEAMRVGAFDFLEKPFDPEKMAEIVGRACNARRKTLDNRELRNELASGTGAMGRLMGDSPSMTQLRDDILDVGQAEGHVLIEGETGTGKTLVAHALHAVGPRANRPVMHHFCASGEPEVQTTRLLGDGTGGGELPLLIEARGGTLILEDIEALSADAQSRLLVALNEDKDGEAPRIIAVSNLQDPTSRLEQVIRPDLFHRIAGLRINVPPLRKRGDDILTLFSAFTQSFAEEYGCEAPKVAAQEAAQMLQAPWPGNVRQLQNIAERAVLQSRKGSGSITSLLISDNEAVPTSLTQEGKPLKEYVEAFERMLIDNTMRRHRGSIASVMEELCLPRRTLNEKMAKYGLQRADYL
ncbi:sigma-54-dependent transcriptional regulator [Qingshengfaniella alkalisoli]|uniref:Sigma-54-dependent Fis family transcriptional regulator n=1 Tax=Qingshengfaniella alkalisoli TaxID=2599296 RepID=A0A5B8I8T0_9RHOB|nr:sigma-54 dependent transcriptional regulator [Qingshengfaniella alkalisoli]QDY69186.1 sigma-54-dependent Fis family transcriptional regulator [Qingshengfaniella alkalisoli]